MRDRALDLGKRLIERYRRGLAQDLPIVLRGEDQFIGKFERRTQPAKYLRKHLHDAHGLGFATGHLVIGYIAHGEGDLAYAAERGLTPENAHSCRGDDEYAWATTTPIEDHRWVEGKRERDTDNVPSVQSQRIGTPESGLNVIAYADKDSKTRDYLPIMGDGWCPILRGGELPSPLLPEDLRDVWREPEFDRSFFDFLCSDLSDLTERIIGGKVAPRVSPVLLRAAEQCEDHRGMRAVPARQVGGQAHDAEVQVEHG